MAIAGKPAITLIDLLRKPPPETKPTAKTDSSRFKEILGQVRADKPAATEVRETKGAAQTASTEASKSAQPKADASSAAQASTDAPARQVGTSDKGASERVSSEERNVTDKPTKGMTQESGSAEKSASPSDTTEKPVEAMDGAKPKLVAESATETSAKAASIKPATEATIAETIAALTQDGKQEISPELLAALQTAIAEASAAGLGEAPTEGEVVSEDAVVGDQEVADDKAVAASLREAATVVSTQQLAVAISDPQLDAEPEPDVPTVGKNVPDANANAENISTEQLLRALEARMVQEQEAAQTSGSWRGGLTVDGSGASSASRWFARGEAIPTASGPTLSVTTWTAPNGVGNPLDVRVADPTMLRATEDSALKSLGTLHAQSQSRMIGAPSQGDGQGAIPGSFDVGREPGIGVVSSSREARSSLDAAQAMLSRRAANREFSGSNAESLMRAAADGASDSRLEALDRMTRESAARSDKIMSFVRSHRMRSQGVSSRPAGQNGMTSSQSAQAANAATPTTSTVGGASTPQATNTQQAYTPLMQFLANETRRHVRLGRREFRIQLNPEALGSVEMGLSMQGDRMVVSLQAASEPSQRIIEDNIAELAKALEAHGFELSFDVPWRAQPQSFVGQRASQRASQAWASQR